MYTDTAIATVPAWHTMNKYAQFFATKFGWVRAHPMRTKGDAHHALQLMAQRNGVPSKMIMDNSFEQTLGEFRRKCQRMGTQIRRTEKFSPWQNACEGAIREVKRGATRKAAKARSPARLWDHLLELEAYIRSNTALNIYELNGQTPETLVSGQTSDISPFCELQWYTWVWHWDSTSGFPEPKEQLGRWLGPAIDIGPAMSAKILKKNGLVAYTASYRPLSADELQNPDLKKELSEFSASIRRKVGGPSVGCLLYTSPSPRDGATSRMPSSA